MNADARRSNHLLSYLRLSACICSLLLIGCSTKREPLQIAWQKEMLTISSPKLPAGKVDVWHLEAFCKRGSTDRDWHQTTIPHKSELIYASPDKTHIKLRTLVEGGVEVLHDIRSTHDEVIFDLQVINHTDNPIDIDWAQPCIRVGDFTGRTQDNYFERCFIFTARGLTLMSQTHREQKARYTPGQVYVPAGIDLNDVNPRPISQTKPVNGLVGCFSADDSMILAAAWSDTQELFQGIIRCIHADFRIGELAPRQRKHLHGRIYIVPNNPAALLTRYRRDFED